LLAFFAVLLGFCNTAHALKSDRAQVVNVNADHSVMSQDSGKAVLTGHVRIDQGSLHADGDQGTGYFDKNNTLQRVVLTGTPAHFQQKLDSGSMVHGSAATVDYLVSENTVILSGNATVVQQGRGEFHGAKLTYNTDSGEIIGESPSGGQVHMTFQPKAKSATPKPASTSAQPAATGAPVSAGSAASASTSPAPASSASALPATASTSGTH
jgi:lipopolysaccharide export system protein LptA